MPAVIPPPKKSLGQHFLIASGISQKIVNLLEVAPEDDILEIGPGPGALTSLLEKEPHSRLVLLEKDSYWASQREENKSPSTTVLNLDALKFDWASLCKDEPWKLIGNLPYNVASPLIWDIVSQCPCCSRAVFMVQKEVGQRICAEPDNKNYGALSVWAQSFARVKMAFSVSPGSFSPPPKVDSAVIIFRPFPPFHWPPHPERLSALLKLCFQSRRKQLGSIFRRNNRNDLLRGLEELRISPEWRPENLSPQQFQELSNYWQTNQ